MSRQITLNDSIEQVQRLKIDEDMSVSGSITKDSTVVCGRCGTTMKLMGPANKKRDEYDGLKYQRGTWQLSCRGCRRGSAKVKLNPIPPMLELDDDEYFERDEKGNIVEIENGAGSNIITPLSNTVKKNGYQVHEETFDEDEHKDIDAPSTEVEAEQMKIFQF